MLKGHMTGLGDFIETSQTGETLAIGVYAAGNVTDPSHQVLQAAAQGSWVAAMMSFSLANEDLEVNARPSANQADWDHRYGGNQIWSGNPNGALVAEVSGAPSGTSLDVGAGEGGDAVWLAEQGWQVTATDISPRVLERIVALSTERNLPISCLHADANALHAYGTATFDLVSAHYASIPRTPEERGLHNVLNAVAPGGLLLIVSHDLEAMRAHAATHENSRPFDPDAYVRVEDFVNTLTNTPDWTIEVNETRARPSGASSHHINDIVFRARRHAN